jgi:hypothetical protein
MEGVETRKIKKFLWPHREQTLCLWSKGNALQMSSMGI